MMADTGNHDYSENNAADDNACNGSATGSILIVVITFGIVCGVIIVIIVLGTVPIVIAAVACAGLVITVLVVAHWKNLKIYNVIIKLL